MNGNKVVDINQNEKPRTSLLLPLVHDFQPEPALSLPLSLAHKWTSYAPPLRLTTFRPTTYGLRLVLAIKGYKPYLSIRRYKAALVSPNSSAALEIFPP